MKKFYLFLTIIATSLCLVGCGDKEKSDAKSSEHMQESNAESSDDTGRSDTESYWFSSGIEAQRVNIETLISDEVPNEMKLLVTHIASYSNGDLYELRLDYNEEFSCRSFDGWDRRHLGYFYVEEDCIYRVRVIDEEFKSAFDSSDTVSRTDAITENEDITTWSEEDLKSKGTIVCQNTQMEDKLGKEEKGFHEVIEIDGNQSVYRSYYNRVETDFYEYFTWERGKGLVYYESGYGAASLQLKITLADDDN